MKAEDASQEMDEDGEFDDGLVVPKLKTYKEAINSLEDICQFLEHKGHGIETLSIVSSISIILFPLKIPTHDKPHFMNASLNEQ